MTFKSDIEIAQESKPCLITEIAENLEIPQDFVECHPAGRKRDGCRFGKGLLRLWVVPRNPGVILNSFN